jgi:hypothetical protein
MLEDSLKNARGTHRLASIVAATYLVFALSVPSLPDLRAIERDIDALLDLRVDAYGELVEAKVTELVGTRREALVASLRECIVAFPLRLHVGSFAPSPAEVVRVVRYRPEDFVLATPTVATGEQVRLIASEADAALPPRVFVPDVGKLEKRLRAFLEANLPPSESGSDRQAPRFTGWRLGDHVTFAEAPIGIGTAPLYFELEEPGRASPVFAEPVDGEWIALRGASFLEWLRERLGDGHFVYRDPEADRKFLNVHREIRPMSLAAAKNRVAELERKRAAGDVAIEIGGVSLPGPVAILGIPAVLAVLVLHLAFAVRHLLAAHHDKGAEFAAFSWPPLLATAGSRWLTRAVISVPAAMGALTICSVAFDQRPWSCVVAVLIIAVAIGTTEHVLRACGELRAVPPTPDRSVPAAAYVWSRESDVYHAAACDDAGRIAAAHRCEGAKPPPGKRMHRGCSPPAD